MIEEKYNLTTLWKEPFYKKLRYLFHETNYLCKLSLESTKDVKVDIDINAYVLTYSGIVFINGVKRYTMIKNFWQYNEKTIFAISYDNKILLLSEYKENIELDNYINPSNYHYKKVLYNDYCLVALTFYGCVKVITDFLVGVDKTNITEVNDIMLLDDKFYVNKNNNWLPLFINGLF